MNTKKRKPLGNAMEEFVFGTQETASPTPSEIVSSAPTPTASLTPEAALPIATPPQPEVSAPEPVSIQSKEPSLMSKLQAPDKEATVRFTVDMSETLRRKLSMLAVKTGRKKLDIVRVLLKDGLKDVGGSAIELWRSRAESTSLISLPISQRTNDETGGGVKQECPKSANVNRF